MELSCSLNVVPCSVPEPGKYVMRKLGAGSVYQDCSNIDLYQPSSSDGSSRKVGTYCLLQDDSDPCYIVTCTHVQVPTITSSSITRPAKPAQIEILTDTLGVDFGSYLNQVIASVRINWYSLIPEAARKPKSKQGDVAIEFEILVDGRVTGVNLASSSGDRDLDRAAWGAITAANPFGPLPTQFKGPYLKLRLHFRYNPDPNKMDDQPQNAQAKTTN